MHQFQQDWTGVEGRVTLRIPISIWQELQLPEYSYSRMLKEGCAIRRHPCAVTPSVQQERSALIVFSCLWLSCGRSRNVTTPWKRWGQISQLKSMPPFTFPKTPPTAPPSCPVHLCEWVGNLMSWCRGDKAAKNSTFAMHWECAYKSILNIDFFSSEFKAHTF